MPEMTDRELLQIVDSEFASSIGSPGGEISNERAKALDYYHSRPMGNEVDGQSQVVTADVANVVDGIMPSLLRMFTTSDNLIAFDPVSAEDVPQAEQESDYVSHLFFKKNDAFMILYTWMFDALLQKNGYVKAWVDESEKITTENYSGLDDNGLFTLLSDEELEPVSSEENIKDGVKTYSVEVKRTRKTKQFVVDCVPPEEFRISSDSRHVDPSKARMVGQECLKKRSDLIDMGFDKDIVDSLTPESERGQTQEQIARRRKTDEQSEANHDKSQDEIKVREAYIRVDYSGDGRSELRQVFTADNKVLGNEPFDTQPFHCLSSKPLPHKHVGTCPAEAVADIQQVTTTILRQTLDNLYQSNNPEIAVYENAIGDNTIDDLLTRRAGSINRFARPVGESFTPMAVPFTAAASFPMLDYFDKASRDRTGVHSDAEGLQPDQLKHIQQSVMGQSIDMSRMKIEAIARIFAETGIKSLFIHLRELAIKHQNKEEIVRLRNQYVPVNPSEWKDRSDVTVQVGLGIGTRDQNKMLLEQIKNMQAEIVQNGGMNVLVTPKNIYNTAAEFVKNANLKDPGLYFTDPGDKLAASPEDETTKIAEMQAQIQERQQMLDAKDQELKEAQIMLTHQVEMAKLQEEKDKNNDKMFVEMENLRNDVTEMMLKYEQRPEKTDPEYSFNPETGELNAST